MTLLQVEIVNPRAGRLLQELAAMDLVVITRDAKAELTLASEKVLASDWLKPEEEEAWSYL